MNFSSLKEYFYRLYNYGLMMMLVPIMGFLFAYYFFFADILSVLVIDEFMNNFMLVFFVVLVLVILTIVHLQVDEKFKKISSKIGLGKKLDEYHLAMRSKVNSYVVSSLLLLVGFAVTAHQGFSVVFIMMIVWHWIQWPTPEKICRQLNLQRDEREMVLTKGESF